MAEDTSVSFQPGPFEPVSTYDAPLVGFTQLMDGEASFASLRDTFLESSKLTPLQRESYATRLKEKYGGTGVANAMIDVATNPFVWLMFLTSPAAVGATGRLFNSGGSGFNAWLRKTGGLLDTLKSAWQRSDGTPLGTVIQKIAKSYRTHMEFEANYLRTMEDELTETISRLHGGGRRVHSLNPDDPRNRHVKGVLSKLSDALAGSHAGFDRDIVRKNVKVMPVVWLRGVDAAGEAIDVGRMTKIGGKENTDLWKAIYEDWKRTRSRGGGQFTVKYKGKRVDVRTAAPEESREMLGGPAWETVNLGEVPESAMFLRGTFEDHLKSIPGAWEYREAAQNLYRYRFLQMLGRKDLVATYRRDLEAQAKSGARPSAIHLPVPEGDLKQLIDPQKALGLWRHVNGLKSTNALPVDDFAVAHMLLGKDARRALRGGHMKPEEFLDLVQEGAASMMHADVYLPRNYAVGMSWDRRTGKFFEIPEHLNHSRRKEHEVLTSTKSAHPREADEFVYSPLDLERMGRNFPEGATDRLNGAISSAKTRISRAAMGANDVAVQRIHWSENTRRYMRSSARTLALLQPVDNEVLALQHQLLKQYREAINTLSEAELAKLNQDLPDIFKIGKIGPGQSLSPGSAYYAPMGTKSQLGKDLADAGMYGEKPVPFDMSIIEAAEANKKYIDDIAEFNRTKAPGTVARKVDTHRMYAPPPGGFAMWDVADSAITMMPGEANRRFFSNTVIPSALGQFHYNVDFLHGTIRHMQTMMEAFLKSPVAKSIADTGEAGRNLMFKFGSFARMEPDTIARMGLGTATEYSYAANMGFNLGTVMLNLTQPWLLAAGWMGGKNVALGYRDAMKDLATYAEKRVKYPVRITDAQRTKLMKESGDHWDETGLTGETFRDVDAVILTQDPERIPGGVKYWSRIFPMKFFEKAEWLNRLTAVHAAKHMAVARSGGEASLDAAGRLIAPDNVRATILDDMARAGSETQFGAGTLNTPALFMGEFFGNPVLRQFRTFVTRSFVGPWVIGGRIGETAVPFGRLGESIGLHKTRVRKFGLPGMEADIPWYVGDPLRMMGASAIMYEGAKNLFGVDYERAGIVKASTEFVTGGRLQEEEYALPGLNPLSAPIIDQAWDFLRGMAGGEERLLRDSLARTMPGGVAIQRLMGAGPKAPEPRILGGLPGRLQRTYADWKSPQPDGTIPVYKGTGELIDYQKPSQLILRGLGVDLNAHRKAGDFDHWLTQQRDEIVQMRAQFLHSLVGNNSAKAQRIQKQFQKKFGFPLTVTKQQLKAFIRRRTIPRTERILDRVPREIRPSLTAAATQSRGAALGLTPAQILASETSFSRPKRADVNLSPEDLAVLRRAVEAPTKGDQVPLEDRGYQGFRPY